MKKYLMTLCLLAFAIASVSAQKAERSVKTGKWGFMVGSTWVVQPIYENYDQQNASVPAVNSLWSNTKANGVR